MSLRLAAPVPADAALPTVDSALAAYRAMLVLRRFQEKAGLLVAMGLIAEPPASFAGKECACVAIAAVKERGECVVSPASESVYLALALGTPVASLFADLLGDKQTDLGATDLIISPNASAALGVALDKAANGSCTFLCLSSRSGDTDELDRGLAAASASKLPLVTVLSVPADDTSIGRSGFDCYEVVDGMDVSRVENAVAAAAGNARQGAGPALIVVRTPAFEGHLAAQNRAPGAKGASREESDPIARLRSRILEDGRSNEAALKSIEKSVREAIAKAATEARGASELNC